MKNKMNDIPGKTSSSITNTFSFEEVINIFSGIDKKIISLHQCSSEDFLGLNRQFKEFHSESNTISDNAQKVLDVITQDKTLEALRNLQILKEQLKNQIQHVELFLSNTGSTIYGTISGIERILFSLRNLRQNLTTIKFLITNLKLDASYDSIPDSRAESDISDMYAIIDSIIKEIHKKENIFLDIKKTLITNQDKLSLLSEQNSPALDEGFKNITKKIVKLVDIRQSALLAIPRLKSITKDCRENVSQIITNLQYHDIIKQKIDHIQLTHRNLINELDSIKEKDGESVMRHNHAKIFLKIRDIAGLQAAQLIHANKSYQNAIREITTSLKDTGESMSGISQLCSQFVSQPELFEVLDESDLQFKLENLSEQANTDIGHIEALSESTTGALQKLTRIKKDYPSLQKSGKTLINDIKRIINRFQKANNNNDDHNISQINLLIEESASIIHEISEGIENENTNLFSVHKTQSSFIAGRTGYLNKLYTTTYGLLSARRKSISDQLSKLQENIRDGSNITQSIRKSIDQVKYYDYFEEVIEEIICELNNINYKLKLIDSKNEEASADKTLSQLKKHYTMESEHRIHENYSNKNGYIEAADPINIEDGQTEDEDNLELF